MSRRRSHIPKFGSWDSDNVPYSAYFDNAQKERGTGVWMNPNEAQENPEAFTFGKVDPGDGFHVNYDSESAEKHPTEGLGKYNGHWSHRRMISSFGSNGSNSDYSLQHQNHHQRRATRGKSLTEDDNFVPSSPGPGRHISASNHSDRNAMSNRASSVPKFGAWDEKDPNAGEGFTVIFNKVKQDKQFAANKFPAAPPHHTNSLNTQKKRAQSKVAVCSKVEAIDSHGFDSDSSEPKQRLRIYV